MRMNDRIKRLANRCQTPTPSREWAVVGDRVVSSAGWVGTVERRVDLRSGALPYVVVRWDRNGFVGRRTITTLRVLKED